MTHASLADLYRNRRKWDEALDHYFLALDIQNEIGDIYGGPNTLYCIAATYREQGDLDEAIETLRGVVELERSLESPDLEKHLALLAEVESEAEARKADRDAF